MSMNVIKAEVITIGFEGRKSIFLASNMAIFFGFVKLTSFPSGLYQESGVLLSVKHNVTCY